MAAAESLSLHWFNFRVTPVSFCLPRDYAVPQISPCLQWWRLWAIRNQAAKPDGNLNERLQWQHGMAICQRQIRSSGILWWAISRILFVRLFCCVLMDWSQWNGILPVCEQMASTKEKFNSISQHGWGVPFLVLFFSFFLQAILHFNLPQPPAGQQVVEEILDAQRPGCPPEYFNIQIPKGHPQYDPEGRGGKEMPFLRSRYDQNTGFSPHVPREQVGVV